MLVLTRREGEGIVIGQRGQVLTGPIVVNITEIRGDSVRLGITAPKDVSILRDNLHGGSIPGRYQVVDLTGSMLTLRDIGGPSTPHILGDQRMLIDHLRARGLLLDGMLLRVYDRHGDVVEIDT